MKKYLLECVYDREIHTPEFFDYLEDAYYHMREEFADAIGYDEAEAENEFKDADKSEACGITNSTAWVEKYGKQIDWKINEIEI